MRETPKYNYLLQIIHRIVKNNMRTSFVTDFFKKLQLILIYDNQKININIYHKCITYF